MYRFIFAAMLGGGILAAGLPCATALAVTAKQKMETCKFGANEQKLSGKARMDFLRKCMSNRNDPRGPATPDGDDEPDHS